MLLSDPLCVLSTGSELSWPSGKDRREKLSAASAAGFDALLSGGEWALFDSDDSHHIAMAEDCVSAGLRYMPEVDVTRFPLHHPLVETHPEFFAIRRDSCGTATIDPRKAMPAAGEAWARLANPKSAPVVARAIGDRLAELAALGIRGFRLLRPDRLGADALSTIAEELSGHDAHIFAGPFGLDRPAGAALAAAGLDYIVSSFGWWDLHAPWLIEEAEVLGRAAPMLAELRVDQYAGDAEEGALERLLLAAAVTASGVIVPDGLLKQAGDGPSALERMSAVLETAARYRGAMRRMSNSADPVAIIMRASAGDPRAAKAALIVLINLTDRRQPAPAVGMLIQRAGVPLDLTHADLSDLAAGDVRLIEAKVAKPIALEGGGALASAIDAALAPRIVLEDITPRVDGGDFPVKRVVGDTVEVGATIFADGHEQLSAELRWRSGDSARWRVEPMAAASNDRWHSTFVVERLGAHEFVVEAWLDRFGGFRRDFRKKLDAGVAQAVDHAEGRALVEGAARRSRGKRSKALTDWHERLTEAGEGERSAALLLDPELRSLMDDADERPHRITSAVQRVDAERLAARYASWYELFPRSATDNKHRHGTFADVVAQLPRIRDMGFDTLYFPPIHPIGRTNRKGPNNALTAGREDPGSPYAIGGREGGHDAIHPELGGWKDFDRLVAAAREHGLEIALDFAVQASPDHPWLEQHPGWFAWRPDGSMKYAENPPKKYQDIVNVDFYGPDAVPGLWEALRDVVLLWVGRGVKVFRVDNPHTKPLPFWEWMIREVRAAHPEVIFLAEAFTRPTMMYRLAKIGFSQSYTYFTWRDRKQELIDYVTELTRSEPKEFYRPHFFVNTPDINPFFLQGSGRPGFRIRAVLAATLSGLFGIYSGFELCEAAPLGPGKEEYLDSEKYEIRLRDWDAPGNIVADVTLLNRLRRAYPALQTHLNTRFYVAHNEHVIWYGKPATNQLEMITVMVNLDPHNPQECAFEVPLWEFGLPDDASIAVEDLADGRRFGWTGKMQHIRIAPDLPYRIWRLCADGGAA